MKRVIVTAGIVFMFIAAARAADYSIISAENLETFIKIMPSYRSLLKQYGEQDTAPAAASSIKAKQYYRQLKDLVGRFGLTVEDFFTLLNRVVSAYPLAKMKAEGANYPLANIGSSLSPGEMNILLKYLPQLDKVLEED